MFFRVLLGTTELVMLRCHGISALAPGQPPGRSVGAGLLSLIGDRFIAVSVQSSVP